MNWWNDPLLVRELAAYLLLCVLTLYGLAKIIAAAGDKPASRPADERRADG